MALTREQRDEFLVYGYIREGAKNNDINISVDIMSICISWYHLKTYLFKAGSNCAISEDRTKVRCASDDEGDLQIHVMVQW